MASAWYRRALPLASAIALAAAVTLAPAGAAPAAAQTANQAATVTVACSVALNLGTNSLSFGSVPPGQTSQATETTVYWTDTCGSSFTATAAVTDLVDYSTGASGPTSTTSGTQGSCGGSIGCIPLYNADIGVSFGGPTCVSTPSGSCSGATLPANGTFTDFAAEGTSTCPEIDVTPGVSLSCPDTALTGTSGAYTAGEYLQTITYTLHVPANAQTGTYNGWVQYTITG